MSKILFSILLYVSCLRLHAFSCDCVSLSAYEIAKAHSVIKGQIIDKAIVDTVPNRKRRKAPFNEYYKYSARIISIIKGREKLDTITIYSLAGDQGASFYKKDIIYIFLSKIGDHYYTGKCSPNIHIENLTKADKRIFRRFKWSVFRNRHKNIDNQLVAKGKIRRKLPVGTWEIFNEDKDLVKVGSFENGLRSGKWITYYSKKGWEYRSKENNLPYVNPEDRIYKIVIYVKGRPVDKKYYSAEFYKKYIDFNRVNNN